MSQPELIRGAVDDLNRPYVKLDLPGFPEAVTAFIDTGFNGSMILDEDQAQRLGWQVNRHRIISATLASQREEAFFAAGGRLSWLGDEMFVLAFVISETAEERRARRSRKRDAEQMVLGVELLLKTTLEINFMTGSVTIARLT